MNENLKDKQPVYAWDDDWSISRDVRFYDAKNNCAFSNDDGSRRGYMYHNYEAIPDCCIHPWIIEAMEYLED